MNEPTNQELKELMLSLFNQLDRKIDALDKKTDVQFTELKGEIKTLEEKVMGEVKRVEIQLTAEIKRVETELKGEIQRVETELKAEIKQVEVELKGEIKRVDEQFKGVDKRLANEEFVSRSAFGALFLGLVTALVKYFFFTPNS